MDKFSLLTVAALMAFTSAVAAKDSAIKPNILLILTDDQGYGDLSTHGHPVLKTPNLDSLGDQSVRFTDFQVAATCSPTRAELMTGLHHFRSGVTHTIPPREHLDIHATTLPQILKSAGYVTAQIGKWHLGNGPGYNPSNRGFDFAIETADSSKGFFNPDVLINGKREARVGFREDILTDEAIQFIGSSKDKPFFCYLATFSPHEPLAAPESDIASFRGLPGVDEKTATYLGMVANIDRNVGRLLARIKELGLDDRTVVVFMNDNGATCGLDLFNAGMRGCKSTPWLGGTRAISFWRWVGHWKPHDVETLTSVMDVLPTLSELAGASVPAALQSRLDGFSLVPLLAGEPVPWADERMVFQHVARWPGGMAAEHKYSGAGVRWKEFLLVRNRPCDDPGKKCSADKYSPCGHLREVDNGAVLATYTKSNAQYHWGVTGGSEWELYDVRKNPACDKNLAASEGEITKKLSAAYEAWWENTYPEMVAAGGDAIHELQKFPTEK